MADAEDGQNREDEQNVRDGQDGPVSTVSPDGPDGPDAPDGLAGNDRQDLQDIESESRAVPAGDEDAPVDGAVDGAFDDSRPLDDGGPVDDGLIDDPAGQGAIEAMPEGGELLVRSAELKSIIEALIFASPEPLSLKAIQKLLDAEPKEDVAAAVTQLKVDYERPCGLDLVEVAGGFQIVTRSDLHEWVRRLFHERSTQKLSVQALETLAVIAYRQPITAAEITEIRGVNTSGVINTLLERHLVKIVGRKAVVGRPFMYATTREFLIRFGLNDIADLPKVQDMVDALGLESPLLVERVTADEQLPLDEPDLEIVDGESDGDHVAPDREETGD